MARAMTVHHMTVLHIPQERRDVDDDIRARFDIALTTLTISPTPDPSSTHRGNTNV
jgi:hypothetical protein